MDESTRLEDEDKFITSGLGYWLHPTVKQSLQPSSEGCPSNLLVADVSRGKQFMGAELFPPEAKNNQVDKISFEQISSPTGLPSDLEGKYDAVCVRVLHTSLDVEQWERSVQKLAGLLKPGAWLQWVDWDPMTARIATVRPGAPDGVLRGVLYDFSDTLRSKKVGSTWRIAASLRPHLEGIDSDMYSISPQVELTKVVAFGATSYLQRCGEYTASKAREVEAKLEHEIDEAGSLVFYDLWCHIARKPAK